LLVKSSCPTSKFEGDKKVPEENSQAELGRMSVHMHISGAGLHPPPDKLMTNGLEKRD